MLPRSSRLLLFFFLLLLSTIARSHNTTNQKLIFILAGQSNMSGRGGVSGNKWDGVVPPESRPSPSVLRLDARLRWEQAEEPLHADIDVAKTCGVGPGLPFANAVARSEAEEAVAVGLVPCAIGGTRIAEWARGRRLYARMVRRARAAMGNSDGRIGALLWYQGESDTVWRADAEAYRGRMERFVKNLRVDLEEPELLVIQVALASGEGPFLETVRQAQIGLNMYSVVCVDANGLPLESDHLHLTTPAQVQLGRMLADAYLNHVSNTHQLKYARKL